jgi:secondary thiamine-phosphate synthase enzyme
MHTLTRALASCHARLEITTDRPTTFVDLTTQVEDFAARSGIYSGLLNIQTLHTTTAIVVNEHEPLLLADFARLLDSAAPPHLPYRHDDYNARGGGVPATERPNGHAHCRALLLCPSATLNVADGRLQLGCWQRIFLAELDGPRRRQVSLLAMGEAVR